MTLRPGSEGWRRAVLFWEGQIIDILDVTGHLVPVTTTQFCYLCSEAATDRTLVNGLCPSDAPGAQGSRPLSRTPRGAQPCGILAGCAEILGLASKCGGLFLNSLNELLMACKRVCGP